MEKFKKHIKTFMISLAAFGVLTMGKLLSTASAHKLALNYHGNEFSRSISQSSPSNLEVLWKLKRKMTIKLSQAIQSVNDVPYVVKFVIENEDEWSLILENAYISPEQFCI